MIRNKKRVKDLGEVFTPEWVVDNMLDLVKDESYRVESRFLEPSCGNGNFLVKILYRKLKTLKDERKVNEYNILRSVSNIYGIDISELNVEESKERMKEVISHFYTIESSPEDFKNTLDYILNKNIVIGDTLNKKEDIFFSNFVIENEEEIKEEIYCFKDLSGEEVLPVKVYSPIHYLKLYKNDGE